jgi:ethanolamine utilization protein EutN
VNFARVIGTVVATAKDPTVHGILLRVVEPCDAEGRSTGDPFIAVDPIASREGDLVFVVRAREAAKALPGKFAPVDAAIVGLVDGIQRDGAESSAP